MDKRLADKKRHIPKEGFNIVGLDDFELPGEQLFLIKHCATEKEAKEYLQEWQKSNKDVVTFIYGPDTI